MNKKTNQKRETTPNKFIEKFSSKDINKTLFTHRQNKTSFNQTGRNHKNKNIIGKVSSTNDSSAKKQANIDDNKNSQFKGLKSNSINLNINSKVKKKEINENNSQNDINENGIVTQKKESFIKNIIIDYIGYHNITISNLSKEHIRFLCKMYIGKKKLVYNLNLKLNDEKSSIITGEFIEGDIQSYEKILSTIREKLE